MNLTWYQTENLLDKEYSKYNAINRRSFYFNDVAMNAFRQKINELREKEAIEELKDIVKYGYVSQHWK